MREIVKCYLSCNGLADMLMDIARGMSDAAERHTNNTPQYTKVLAMYAAEIARLSNEAQKETSL